MCYSGVSVPVHERERVREPKEKRNKQNNLISYAIVLVIFGYAL